MPFFGGMVARSCKCLKISLILSAVRRNQDSSEGLMHGGRIPKSRSSSFKVEKTTRKPGKPVGAASSESFRKYAISAMDSTSGPWLLRCFEYLAKLQSKPLSLA
jgi:hypothetical protein